MENILIHTLQILIEIEIDSTDIIDLKITKKLSNSDFYIKVTNALDETYQRPHGYNQENRVLKFGIKY